MTSYRHRAPLLAGAAAALVWATSAAAAGAPRWDWLSLCAKCLSPTVVQRSGIGTAHADATARSTPKAAAEWCDNWQPDADQGRCVREAMASEDARKTYRASADCLHGRITAIDGVTYRLAGIWTSGIGRGRTRWRDPSGQVLGTDNGSGGLAISEQWEVLCPGPVAFRPAHPPRQAAPGAPATQFAVGQEIEARYGQGWVRGRVTRIWRHEGASGHEIAYDVRLVNGKRGILPATMLRRPASSP